MSADDPQIERDEDDPQAQLAAALARSRSHARAALSEAIACLGALLDAASLTTTGVPADANGVLRAVMSSLTGAAQGLAPEGAGGELVDAVAAALDQEIERWERRAEDDPDARAVLRAFLGVREVLWELGVRRQNGTRARPPAPARPRQRVQRVPVQGASPSA